jgi:hypothetical protein
VATVFPDLAVRVFGIRQDEGLAPELLERLHDPVIAHALPELSLHRLRHLEHMGDADACIARKVGVRILCVYQDRVFLDPEIPRRCTRPFVHAPHQPCA